MSDKNWKYVCEDCQTQINSDGERERVDKVRETSSRGDAETLARIHRIKSGHNPTVMSNG